MASNPAAALAVRDKVQKFLEAACAGNLDLFKKLARQLDVGDKGLARTVADVKDANKRTALHFAAREGKTSICKYLIEELGLDVDIRDEDSETPLIHASRQEHIVTAKYLLERGAEPAASSELGATSLHHSAGTGNVELLNLLLAKGVDVDSHCESGTPLIWAAGHGQDKAVKVLLEHHANPNAHTDDDITPLLSSVAAGSLPCLKLLIESGADVNVSAGGTTPLHVAADIGSTDLINSLLKAGADANAEDENFGKARIRMRKHKKSILARVCPYSWKYPVSSVAFMERIVVGNNIVKELKVGTFQKYYSNRYLNADDGHVVNFSTERTEDGLKPIQTAALRSNRKAVMILLPLTFPIQKIKDWSVDAVIDFMQSEFKQQEEKTEADARKENPLHLVDPVKVTPEAKEKSLEAKSRGNESFKGGDYLGAIDAYTQRFEEAANAFYEGVLLDPENQELVSAFRYCSCQISLSPLGFSYWGRERAIKPG
ncbi:unnamed protein product [Spirodela intermedia]|uniref:Uncharacterized protein n=1 Tax=Spirodela intermedia TaxID=51605 RepID=A0A7I8JW89_SPIIN|nr:unnamed protein product [Spirodela intermedia]